MSDKTQTTMAIAGLAMGVCALAGIAYFVGWTPWRDAPIAALPAAPSKPKAATMQSGVVLLPGETLVAPPDPVAMPPKEPTPPAAPAQRGPSPPRYAKPAIPPTSAPRTLAQQAPRPSPPAQYSREGRRPSAYERSTRSVCLNCGVVTSITRGDYDWEIRVRFDDGGREIHRFYDRPRFQVGDAVRLEDGRLLPD